MRVAVLLLTAVLSGFGAAQIDKRIQGPGDDVVFPGPDVEAPRLVHKVEPEYSRAARNAGIQGTVLLNLVIDEHGLPQEISVFSPLGFGLDESALRCVSRWRFKPATKDGKAVRVEAQVAVNFRLNGTNFDSKAEHRRTVFNSIVMRVYKQGDGTPSDQEVKAMEDLAKHKFAGAEYILGIWELTGGGVAKDATAGIANVRRAADQNYGPALFFLWRAEEHSSLTPAESARRQELIQNAALYGSKEAQLRLGEMYEKGEGVGMDPEQAKKYFRLCAAGGIAKCQFRLGELLIASPQGKKRDLLQGIAWLELAGH